MLSLPWPGFGSGGLVPLQGANQCRSQVLISWEGCVRKIAIDFLLMLNSFVILYENMSALVKSCLLNKILSAPSNTEVIR